MEEQVPMNNNQNEVVVKKDVKLNLYLLSQIAIYLVHNNSFKSIFELSLLSKSSFKIFLNAILSYSWIKYNFIFKNLNEFEKYIKINNNNNKDGGDGCIDKEEKQYKLKLIQYKELNKIRLNIDQNWGSMKKSKLLLNQHCTNLKHIIISKMVDVDFSFNKDYTCGGFFKVKRLLLSWNEYNLPNQQPSKNKYDSDSDSDDEYYLYHDINISFGFINYYNPKKIYIDAYNDDKCPGFELADLNGILDDHSFIKSFKIRASTEENISTRLISSFKNGKLESNKNLERLIMYYEDYEDRFRFENYGDFEYSETVNNDLKKLLDYFIDINIANNNGSGSKLHTLGLIAYRINDHKLLSPLIQLQNITTLVCDSFSLDATLKHCNENQNVKRLKFIFNWYIRFCNKKIVKMVNLFENFLNNNSSSLTSITCSGIYSEKKKEILLKLFDNSNIKLILKK